MPVGWVRRKTPGVSGGRAGLWGSVGVGWVGVGRGIVKRYRSPAYSHHGFKPAPVHPTRQPFVLHFFLGDAHPQTKLEGHTYTTLISATRTLFQHIDEHNAKLETVITRRPSRVRRSDVYQIDQCIQAHLFSTSTKKG